MPLRELRERERGVSRATEDSPALRGKLLTPQGTGSEKNPSVHLSTKTGEVHGQGFAFGVTGPGRQWE